MSAPFGKSGTWLQQALIFFRTSRNSAGLRMPGVPGQERLAEESGKSAFEHCPRDFISGQYYNSLKNKL